MLGTASLRCHFGWHSPRSGGVWNHGYCFTTCSRCGRDMVRSAFGEWHVPKGLRVVANGNAAAIADFDAAMTARDLAAERPAPVAVAAAEPALQRIARPVAAAAPSRAGQLPVSESPFDFEDFDAIDPTMGVFADPAPLPDPPAPSLSRAAP